MTSPVTLLVELRDQGLPKLGRDTFAELTDFAGF